MAAYCNHDFIPGIRIISMEEISKCECPPTAESYENEDGMLICKACGGWVESRT